MGIRIKILLLLWLLLIAQKVLYAQSISSGQKVFYAERITGQPPVIDGQFDEDAWDAPEWEGGFIQQDPFEGALPAQPTYFKLVYDDNYLYVAIQAFDNNPGEIVRWVTRRDSFDGDWVAIAFDSYYDRRTAFSFGVNAAGVKNDLIISNDDQMDDTWDPVWFVKTSITDKGWNAEMKIPLTQIRFARKEDYTWGLQVSRFIYRLGEFSVWKPIPRESSRWVSLFGDLRGIREISPRKEVEFIPHIVGMTEKYLPEEGNPFETGRDDNVSVGLDSKVAVTNDLTLNLTVNPDFGQVEADPSEVNLTAFETFFRDKRPFFVEGSNIYDFPVTRGDGSLARDNLFYSRRIGRQPKYSGVIGQDEYADFPEFTRISGALKLSGKTKNGWSIGLMEAITEETSVAIDNDGNRREELMEPLTNFFNTRLQKDINGGQTLAGGMFTATNRFFNNDDVEFIHQSAYTGGLDFTQYWKNRNYFAGFQSVFSHLTGSPQSIISLQRSPQRYFQRPDAPHVTVDSSKTSLTGSGGTISGGKIAGGRWRYQGTFAWRSPELELNDMGYLRQADIMQQLALIEYRIWKPFSVFRELNFGFNQASGWDFSELLQSFSLSFSANARFKNYWSFNTSVSRYLPNNQRTELRGGPAIRFPGDWNHSLGIGSDERRKLTLRLTMFNNWGDIDHSRFFNMRLAIGYRPLEALSMSFEPQYSKQRRDLQYIRTADFNGEPRYILSTLYADIVSTNIRINFSLTPDLSLQYWGQPYIFTGNYSSFKKVAEPKAERYEDRLHIYKPNEIFYNTESGSYEIDESGDGLADYSFRRPDFNFLEFRSNFVIRWEYIPGSTLYLVWSQGRTDRNAKGEFDFVNEIESLFNIVPHNVFLIKLSYRISL